MPPPRGRPSARVVRSPRAENRLAAADEWLRALPPAAEALVVAPSLEAGRELLVRAAGRAGRAFGWRRATLPIVASRLSLGRLHDDDLAPAGALSRDAVVARALEARARREELGRYAAVADAPGFVRALARSLDELRMAGLGPPDLVPVDPELAALARAVQEQWGRVGLADRARVFRAAAAVARDPESEDALLGRPTLLLDLPLHSAAERELAVALLERAPEALVTVPAGDRRTRAALGDPEAAGVTTVAGEGEPVEGEASALERLQAGLFRSAPAPAPAERDESLTVFSAPGEGREAIEIARRLLALAREGVPFDRVAVLLRAPEEYRPYLEEALGRAGIPAWFEHGVRRPDPAGRAFLALLRCRREDYSAVRFAEYLSIGQVPDATEDGGPPPAEEDAAERWVAPEDELLTPPGLGAGPPGEATAAAGVPDRTTAAVGEPVRTGTLRVPRRWEKLLVDASVVGGLDRWERRLDGLAEQLGTRLDGLEEGELDEPRGRAIRRDLEDVGHLRAYALPLLEALAALPDEAEWRAWLDALGELATRGLRRPRRVLGVLSELAPMGPVGPVRLPEVLRVLAPRLLEAASPPEGPRFGRVFVGPIDAARGRAFDVVFVPGLAERVFPPKISEDPILLDGVRERLDAGRHGEDGAPGAPRLPTNDDRVATERLALRIAVGAARRRVVLSYPRLEMLKARPRVPSFYALEAARAAEGRLPRFEELASRAEQVADARIGWPAPPRPRDAIDDAEYDLAVLDDLDARGLRGEAAVKAAGHLLHTNPHLARALRFRAYRWEVPKWTRADGLVQPFEPARAALAPHAVGRAAFSATSLQHFAACPYRFFLHSVHRLAPREEPTGIEELDPLERGSLVHRVQFELLSALQRDGLLPVRPETLGAARDRLDATLDRVADDYADRLVPAIERVWEDGIESIRGDLREWLHRESRSREPFTPWRFELSFGLPHDEGRDERSVDDPVTLGTGLRLRGAIDVVEKSADGDLRVTDHKTGRARAKRGSIVQGGEILQPVLYALVAERIFVDPGDPASPRADPEPQAGSAPPAGDAPDAGDAPRAGPRVLGGRLYYCTADGGFETHEVPLDAAAREAAGVVTEVVRRSIDEALLPAVPARGACRWCDYLPVCGPDEERRILGKPEHKPLVTLRSLR